LQVLRETHLLSTPAAIRASASCGASPSAAKPPTRKQANTACAEFAYDCESLVVCRSAPTHQERRQNLLVSQNPAVHVKTSTTTEYRSFLHNSTGFPRYFFTNSPRAGRSCFGRNTKRGPTCSVGPLSTRVSRIATARPRCESPPLPYWCTPWSVWQRRQTASRLSDVMAVST
jgi:hypothetical protein